MADQKISQLTPYTSSEIIAGDLFAVVDTTNAQTKNMTLEELGSSLINTTDLLSRSGGALTGDLFFPDNIKAGFGDFSDLEIYHDGTYSYVGPLKFDADGHIVDPVVIDAALGVNGIATFSDDVSIGGELNLTKATNNFVDHFGTLRMRYYDGAAFYDTMSISSTTTVFNDTGRDLDFRIESDTNTHAFFLQGSDGNVGIGTSVPTSKLEVANLSGTAGVEVSAYRNGTTYGNSYIKFNGPRSNTGDGSTMDGRGAITLLGNSSGVQGSLWINAASATLLPETADEATMQGYQAGLNLNSDGEFSFWDNGTQRFIVNSSGNVGIGTDSPATKLDVRGNLIVGTSSTEGGQIDLRNPDGASTGGTIDVAAANTMRIFQTADNSVLDIGQLVGTGGTIRLHTGATERIRITPTGNVGIAAPSPVHRLHVSRLGSTDATLPTFDANTAIVTTPGTNNATSGSAITIHANVSASSGILFSDTNDSNVGYISYQHSDDSMRFGVNDSERMRIDSSGVTKAQSYAETYVTLSGTTPTITCTAGNFFGLNTTGNTTFTFASAPASGTGYGFSLRLTAGGTHTLTWPASVKWPGGTAPDNPASGETNIYAFVTHDGGTTWYGMVGGEAFA